MNGFVHAIRKRSKKCLAQKVGYLGLLGPIPMIQPPLDSSCGALQYEHGIKFFHREIRSIQNQENSVQQHGVSGRVSSIVLQLAGE